MKGEHDPNFLYLQGTRQICDINTIFENTVYKYKGRGEYVNQWTHGKSYMTEVSAESKSVG